MLYNQTELHLQQKYRGIDPVTTVAWPEGNQRNDSRCEALPVFAPALQPTFQTFSGIHFSQFWVLPEG